MAEGISSQQSTKIYILIRLIFIVYCCSLLFCKHSYSEHRRLAYYLYTYCKVHFIPYLWAASNNQRHHNPHHMPIFNLIWVIIVTMGKRIVSNNNFQQQVAWRIQYLQVKTKFFKSHHFDTVFMIFSSNNSKNDHFCILHFPFLSYLNQTHRERNGTWFSSFLTCEYGTYFLTTFSDILVHDRL